MRKLKLLTVRRLQNITPADFQTAYMEPLRPVCREIFTGIHLRRAATSMATILILINRADEGREWLPCNLAVQRDRFHPERILALLAKMAALACLDAGLPLEECLFSRRKDERNMPS
jgi:hypothetical protein